MTLAYVGLEHSYSVYGATTGTAQYQSATQDSSAIDTGAGAGSITLDPYDGTETINVTDYERNIAYQVKTLSPHFIGEGTTTLANGVSIRKDTLNGIAVANYTDVYGTAWSASGTADPDGISIDVTLTSSTGYSDTSKYNKTWAPSLLALNDARVALGSRHTMGRAGDVAIAAGIVGGVMSAVGAVTAAMGLLPATGVAFAIVAGAAVVFGVATKMDNDEKDKAGKKC